MATATKSNGAGKVDGVSEGPAVVLKRLERVTVDVPIEGTSELITHRWSEKAKRMMLEAQMNRGTRAKKEPKNPEADYESSIYRLADGRCAIPATAFKAALVGAVRHFDGLTMVQAKAALFVSPEEGTDLVPIVGTPHMREDMVRLESGVADIRYRAGFWPWSATLKVTFLPHMLDVSSVFALVDAAGLGGVGEWRPSAPKSASGSYGMFRVVG
jgi:hypothetical protein